LSFARSLRRRIVGALALGLPLALGVSVALGVPALAQEKRSNDPVVATVDKEEVRRSEVDATIKMYGAELSKLSPGEQATVALDRLIDAKLVMKAARDQKLHEDPTVKRQLAEAERRILQQALLGRVIAEATTEKALKEP
jgi:peptidyl-prolyl cis-trans isomerase C